MDKLINAVTQRTPEIFTVEYEPGDGTHYSFLVYRDGPDEFTIAPCQNSFIYPQRINCWQDFDPSDNRISEIAAKYNCNPWTVKAVIKVCTYIKVTDWAIKGGVLCQM
jgi:hypothetical protein